MLPRTQLYSEEHIIHLILSFLETPYEQTEKSWEEKKIADFYRKSLRVTMRTILAERSSNKYTKQETTKISLGSIRGSHLQRRVNQNK